MVNEGLRGMNANVGSENSKAVTTEFKRGYAGLSTCLPSPDLTQDAFKMMDKLIFKVFFVEKSSHNT